MTIDASEKLFERLKLALGDVAAENFVRAFSGRNLRIPQKMLGVTLIGKQIRETIGADLIAAFAENFGGEEMYLSAKVLRQDSMQFSDRLARNDRIRRLRKQGWSRTELAKKFKLTERSISMITGTFDPVQQA